MKRVGPWVLIILAAASSARGEKIYAVTEGTAGALHLVLFDSATPSSLEMSAPLTGDLSWMSSVLLEFDPAMRTLYGFGVPPCHFDPCPPAIVTPATIDPASGASTATEWPGFPGSTTDITGDLDIHPATREIRLLGNQSQNRRYSIPELELLTDEPVNLPGWYAGIAHSPPGPGGEVDTYAVRYPDYFGEIVQLVRIGGPGGDPPASSGEVTVIGSLAIAGRVVGLDISENGTAYLATYSWEISEQNLLYTVDLANASVQELGLIATPLSQGRITGLAVAPHGIEPSIVEVPGLSRLGLVALVSLLASAAFLALGSRKRPNG